jgi:hypothetical protein
LDGRAKNLREEIYTWLVIATGMFLLFTNRPVLDDPMTVVKIVFMGILIAIGEASPVVLPNNLGTVSVSLPISIAVAVLYGPGRMWMASLGHLKAD